MIKIFTSITLALVQLLKLPFLICFSFFFIFTIISTGYFFYFVFYKKMPLKKGSRVRQKKINIIKRLFMHAPKQFVLDTISRDPDFFRPQGLIIFEGRQGSGKSIAMAQYARAMIKEYPLSKCISNMQYKYESTRLSHWKQLITFKNGINGVIVIMDELQNWFSSNQSKNFPPEMLSVITQNRKNRRIILGTSQNFYLLAKAIRSQATEIRRCKTFLGCVTVVRRLEPFLDSEGNVQEYKHRGWYFFVHDEDLRHSYNTYAVIDSLTSSGFKDSVNSIN